MHYINLSQRKKIDFTETKKENKIKSRASNDQTLESAESPLKDISNMDPQRYSMPFQFAPKRNNYLDSSSSQQSVKSSARTARGEEKRQLNQTQQIRQPKISFVHNLNSKRSKVSGPVTNKENKVLHQKPQDLAKVKNHLHNLHNTLSKVVANSTRHETPQPGPMLRETPLVSTTPTPST